MEQSLPANVKAELAKREDFVRASDEIVELNKKLKTLTLQDEIDAAYRRRDEVYQIRRQLISDELKEWQDVQPHTLGQEASVADRISYFNRVRRLNPPRDRLASTLFLSVPLRSEKGRNAVHDMIALYRDTPSSVSDSDTVVNTAVNRPYCTTSSKYYTTEKLQQYKVVLQPYEHSTTVQKPH
jgi:hypothetical protein